MDCKAKLRVSPFHWTCVAWAAPFPPSIPDVGQVESEVSICGGGFNREGSFDLDPANIYILTTGDFQHSGGSHEFLAGSVILSATLRAAVHTSQQCEPGLRQTK